MGRILVLFSEEYIHQHLFGLALFEDPGKFGVVIPGPGPSPHCGKALIVYVYMDDGSGSGALASQGKAQVQCF